MGFGTMAMAMKNFVFDLYGTLADIRTDEGDARFRDKFLKAHGRDFGTADFFARYGEIMAALPPLAEPDVLDVFIRIAEEGGRKLTRAAAENIAKDFRKLSLKKLKRYAFVRRTLRKLKGRGATIIILSNAQSAFTRGEITELGLDVFCDGIELSSDFGMKKPALEFFLYALEKYGLNPTETLYIGNDIRCDVLGARAAGLKTAYIRTKISPSCDSLEKAAEIADFTAKNHAQLCKLLLSLCG